MDRAIMDRLKGSVPDYFSEDVAHLSEHAIEFQLPFVQTNTGSDSVPHRADSLFLLGDELD